MKAKEFIDDMNVVLSSEYAAILLYIIHSQRLSRQGMTREANELLFIANDEIRHAENLARHVRDLGGKPIVETKWKEGADFLDDMLKTNLESERKSIVLYKKLIVLAEKEKFTGIKAALEDQLADEVRHSKLLAQLIEKGTL